METELPVIETHGLTKTYKGIQALKSLDLQVQPNSICGFLGPNGAGKTTTIKLLLGLAQPTGGSGRVFGKDILKENDEIRRRVGYMSQDPRFYEYMTARETLRLTARFFYAGPKPEIERRVAETLELAGLTDKADRPIKSFSGGERQRLGIAQAQVNYPDLLILDEPAASLDPIGRRDVLEVMARLRIAGVMGLGYLNLLFFQTLALMLATFFNGRGPVLGISMALAWAGPMPFISTPIQKYAPWLYDILPWRLLIDFNTNQPLAYYLANSQPLPTVVPIIATALWCVLFTAVAIWRTSREEF